MIVSKKMTIVDKPGLRLMLEYNEHYVAVHIQDLKMTKSNYLDFVNAIEDIHSFCTTAGYEAIWTGIPVNDPKTEKLLKKIGAKYVGTSQGMNVFEYRGVS